jgi:hypothetical protein
MAKPPVLQLRGVRKTYDELVAVDQVFAELVQSNNEGAIVTGPSGRGIALTEDNVDRLVTSEPMAPSGAACLELAWRHRELLLGD